MMIADGVLPSNKDQGYILRRLLRRAIRTYHQAAGDPPFFVAVADSAIETLKGFYTDLEKKREMILAVIEEEKQVYENVGEGRAGGS